jgi:hypothetical protein
MKKMTPTNVLSGSQNSTDIISQIFPYLLLLAILFAADVILFFIKAPVILLPAVIFVIFPLV